MYDNLLAEMKRAHLTYTDLCSVLNCTISTIYLRFNDKFDWKLGEMVKIQNLINKRLNVKYTLDYLFKRG